MITGVKTNPPSRVLKHLLRHIDGKVLVLWDRSRIHGSQVVKDLLASIEDSRIHLEQFPAYAPELSPDEGVWNYLKRVELKNVNCQDLDQLYNELRKAKERLRHKTEVIKSFSRMAGLYQDYTKHMNHARPPQYCSLRHLTVKLIVV